MFLHYLGPYTLIGTYILSFTPYFSLQTTNEQAWQSMLNTWISFWMEWLVRGRGIFLKKVVGLILESKICIIGHISEISFHQILH